MAPVDTIKGAHARVDTHEAVCVIRYEGICARLKRIESIGIAISGSIIYLLVSIVMKMN